jgi:alpha-ribazole phosphatase
MIIIMTRHGQTEGNAQRRYVGATDMPLSEEGLRLTRAGQQMGNIGRVYVTPLQRTQQTARIQYPSAELVIVDDLREMNFGIFEGRTYDELDEDPVFQAWMVDGGMQPMQDGEGRLGFSIRVRDALARLIREAHSRGEEKLHIVAHGGTIMALMSLHALPEQPYNKWWIENLQGYRVTLDPATWQSDSKFLTTEPVDLGLKQS